MLKGSIPALITPFNNGQVDIQTLKKLVEWHISQGSHGIVPVGTTGESPTLSHEEHETVVSEVVKTVAGRIPVVAGAGSNNTVEALRFMKHAKSSNPNVLKRSPKEHHMCFVLIRTLPAFGNDVFLAFWPFSTSRFQVTFWEAPPPTPATSSSDISFGFDVLVYS